MTEIADDRSWWADVEHLRPGAEALPPQPRATRDQSGSRAVTFDLEPEWHDVPASARRGRITGRPVDELERDEAPRRPRAAGDADAPRRSRAVARDRSDHADRESERPSARRGRSSGRTAPAVHEDLPVLRRADVASFADAMDLDGAFGAPVRRAESREIVLGRGRETGAYDDIVVDADGYAVDKDVVIAAYLDADDHAHAAHGAPDRKTVRIIANPGINAAVAERRKLREIEPRRPKASVADRAAASPDRIAMWAVVLGILLVLIAASSAGIA